jgi:EAL domain-containing protein (putative c-di-GMP-specific phosphodiesterase class I)
VTSVIQLATPHTRALAAEESVAAIAAILIVGMGDQRVSVLTVLWLAAVATGVLARGGRVHWIGRTVLLVALVLPVVRDGDLGFQYAALCVATIGLLLTSGRLTRELNRLLRQARVDAQGAQTLLMAGDIAARVAGAVTPGPVATMPTQPLAPEEAERARVALARLIEGNGVTMFAQPIVDIQTGEVHAYEALARFEGRRTDSSPLHWFALAAELGERPALERACLRAALALFDGRPAGTRLSVNLSVAVLLEPATVGILEQFSAGRDGQLENLIIEITEETLVSSDLEVGQALDDLRHRGALLAIDDVGAGYSGLSQITAVLPDYIKLDRSMVSGIDRQPDRAALVSALAGYCNQVGGLLVAEGIEHEPELRKLAELGVPLAQGFYLARPGPPWPRVDFAPPATRRRAVTTA